MKKRKSKEFLGLYFVLLNVTGKEGFSCVVLERAGFDEAGEGKKRGFFVLSLSPLERFFFFFFTFSHLASTKEREKEKPIISLLSRSLSCD